MRSGTIGRLAMILLWLLVLAAPTAVFALEDHGGHKGVTSHIVYQEGDEEGSVTEEGSDGGVSFVLTLIAALIFLIIAVVAILGAVSLGIIGIGYASVSSGES